MWSESQAPIIAYFVQVVNVTGVQLDPTVLSLTVGGDAATLIATVAPNNATYKNVTWTTSDSNVASVTNGVVTATGVGTATITATATNGTTNTSDDKTATCTVTVNAAAYTVTYDPGRGSGTMEPTTVARTPEGKYPYVVESCGFTPPDGKTFDLWKGSDGKEYRVGGEYELTGDLTLTAQWKDASQGGGSQQQRRGSGLSGDLVFFGGSGMDDGWEYIGGGVPQRAYRVSFAPMQGGSAYFLLSTGESGETMNVYPQSTVRVVATPAPGYRLASIVWSMIDGSASYDITESQTFVMPAMDAVVYVTFQPIG